jgi:hypothetical protein
MTWYRAFAWVCVGENWDGDPFGHQTRKGSEEGQRRQVKMVKESFFHRSFLFLMMQN